MVWGRGRCPHHSLEVPGSGARACESERGNAVSDDRTDSASAIERSRHTDPVLAVGYVRQVAREAAEKSGHRKAAQVVMALRQEYRIMPLKLKEASPNRVATWQAVRAETRSLVAMAMGGTADKALFDVRVATPADQTLPRTSDWAPDPHALPAVSLQLAALRTHRPPLSNPTPLPTSPEPGERGMGR